MVTSVLPLVLKDALVRKRGRDIVGPISLDISGTGVTVAVGPNGAGKTTLLRLMHGLERLRSGSVDWNCETLIAQEKQAFVFQTPIMLRRTVIENLVFPMRLQKKSKIDALAAAREWLQRINLLQAENLDAAFLSGGERQKLALARALSRSPDVLFLDEPTSNLDGTSTREIETLIKEAASSGVRIVMSTHDVSQCKRLADEVLFLYRGKLHESGKVNSFFTKPSTNEAKAFISGDIVE